MDVLLRVAKAAAAIALAALALYLTDIGCIIRFFTGVSCPGCGLTRAWISALQLDFAAAFAYHPLFWLVPPVLAACVLFERLTQLATRTNAARPRQALHGEGHLGRTWARRSLAVFLGLCLAAFIAVWAVRLLSPADAGLLFGGVPPTGVPDDVVCIAWARP